MACTIALAPGVARAGSWAVRAHWQRSSDATVVGYRVYTRHDGLPFALALDAGMPVAAADGTLAATVHSLAPCVTYGAVVTAYHADGSESAYSNEVTLGYATAAPLIDSDGDGLTNAAEDRNLDCVVEAGETDPFRGDTDGDGINDAMDACPGTGTGAAVNASGCSCAQVVCNDGNACNGVETCVAGVCQPGTPPSCDDGNPCTTDACSASAGCTHTAIAGCNACTGAAECNDGNPCTTDSCVAGRCAHAAVANGTSCEDGNPCNGHETCGSGVCRAGTPPSCDDANPCTADACSATAGCTHTPVAGCVACTSASQCNDGNACTADACSGGRCTHVAAADGSSCSDGLFCDGAEVCLGGACSPGIAPDCDDRNACTQDACDESQRRCVHAAVAGCCATDADCTLADACHTNARCDAGRCVSDAVACPDPGQCADAACDPRLGCTTTPLPDGTPCDDANACTSNDVCTNGTCTGMTLSALTVGADDPDATSTRLTLRTTPHGVSVSARATFPAPGGLGDPTTGDLHVVLEDASGTMLLDTVVPGSALVPRGADAVFYRDDRRDVGGGFTYVVLQARGGRGSLAIRAVIPSTPAGDGPVVAEPLQIGQGGSATLDWNLRSGNTCAKGSGRCTGRARRCRS